MGNMINPDYDRIMSFAKDLYECEPGTKKAVDNGTMTMRELEIAQYISDMINLNCPDSDGGYKSFGEHERVFNKTRDKVLPEAAKNLDLEASVAREIFEKVMNVPRTVSD